MLPAVAGCPPRPEALIHGIIMLHEKVRREKIGQYKAVDNRKPEAVRLDAEGRTVAMAERR